MRAKLDKAFSFFLTQKEKVYMSKTLYKASIKDLLPEEKHTFYIGLIDQMTPCELKITDAICHFTDKLYIGDWLEMIPSRIEIAKKAKVSESSVRDYIKKYEGIVFTHETRRKSAFKHDSNKYFTNIEFYEVVKILKRLNCFHCWKEKRKWVIEGLIEDPWFLCSKVAKNVELSTTNLPTVYLLNLPAIKSYLKSSLYSCIETGACKQRQSHQNKQSDEIFGDIPLTYAQKTRLLEFNVLVDLRQTRQQYEKYVFTYGKKVFYPYSFVKKQTEKNRSIRKLDGKYARGN